MVGACTGKVATVYLALLGVSFLVVGHAVVLNVRQIRSLPGELAKIKVGDDELEREKVHLMAKFPNIQAMNSMITADERSIRFGALKATFNGNKVKPAKEEEVKGELATKEKRLLRLLQEIEQIKQLLMFKKRSRERVVSGALQVSATRARATITTPHTASLLAKVIVEDLPFTVLNTLYVVFGCGVGLRQAKEGEMECEDEDAGTTRTLFMFSTILTVAFATKKLTDVANLTSTARHMDTIKKMEIPSKLEDAQEMLREIKHERASGGSKKLLQRLQSDNKKMAQRLSLFEKPGSAAQLVGDSNKADGEPRAEEAGQVSISQKAAVLREGGVGEGGIVHM